MPRSNTEINLSIEFEEGCFLIIDGAPYFLPYTSNKAYLSYGSKDELLGKVRHELPTRSEAFDKYDLTYEVEDGKLIAARLITPFNRSAGKLSDEAQLQLLNDKLQNGEIDLIKAKRAPYVENAAEFSDGRQLVTVYGLGHLSRRLFMGKPGNLEEIEIASAAQSGNNLYFTAEDGAEISFEGYGRDCRVIYGDRVLSLIEITDPENLAVFGIPQDDIEPHLDPFCPELAGPEPD